MPTAETLSKLEPELIVDVWLYPPEAGGRLHPIHPGWGCPCFTDDEGWDGWPLLGSGLMQPGERRRFGFVFLSGPEAADAIKKAGRFMLWEGRHIGEAEVVG